MVWQFKLKMMVVWRFKNVQVMVVVENVMGIVSVAAGGIEKFEALLPEAIEIFIT